MDYHYIMYDLNCKYNYFALFFNTDYPRLNFTKHYTQQSMLYYKNLILLKKYTYLVILVVSLLYNVNSINNTYF